VAQVGLLVGEAQALFKLLRECWQLVLVNGVHQTWFSWQRKLERLAGAITVGLVLVLLEHMVNDWWGLDQMKR
jgi:hypothetical protein